MSPKWKHLEQVALLDAITEQSFSKPQVLFKHSTRCSISTMAMNRLLRLEDAFYQQADFYYLDLIAHRDVSAAIAERYHVHHESPQVIILKQGDATYDASHMEISVAKLTSEISA
ncbi:MAG: bacillithiol system redox-active protein YtxJ [Bacteroidota bacterium]|jgi:bacillithiol system protein YtxJ